MTKVTRHTFDASEFDEEAARQYLGMLMGRSPVIELRTFPVDVPDSKWPMKGQIGYFDDLDAAVAAVSKLSRQQEQGTYYEGVFATIQGINPELIARGANAMKNARRDSGTSNADVITYHWLAIDIDPERVSGTSATKLEMVAAVEKAKRVASFLEEGGWPPPAAMAMSGNGAHIYYRINLAYDGEHGENVELVKATLKGLDQYFGDERSKIDASVASPARVMHVIGSWKRKGENDEFRPWRVAEWIIPPAPKPVVVKKALLRSVAAIIEESSAPLNLTSDNPDAYTASLEGIGLAVRSSSPGHKGGVFVLHACPVGGHDEDLKSWSVMREEKVVAAGCPHAKCAGEDHLAALREMLGDTSATILVDATEAALQALTDMGMTMLLKGKRNVFQWLNEEGEVVVATSMLDAKNQTGADVPLLESDSGPQHPLQTWIYSKKHVRKATRDIYDPSRPYWSIERARLNLWEGFAFEPKRGARGSLEQKAYASWVEHVREHACGGDRELANYVLDLIAWTVQHPTRRSMVALTFIGKPGGGKNTIFEPLVNVFGEHGLIQPRETGTFNSHLEGKGVIVANECVFFNDPREINKLKAGVTDELKISEAKFVDATVERNIATWILATNSELLAIEPNDRRFCILEVIPPEAGIEWFEARRLIDAIDVNQGSPLYEGFHRHWLAEMLARDVSAFRPNPAPMTEAKASIVLDRGLPPFERWVSSVWLHGQYVVHTQTDPWLEVGPPVELSHEQFIDLHKAFVEWVEKGEPTPGGFVGKHLTGFAKKLRSISAVGPRQGDRSNPRREISPRSVIRDALECGLGLVCPRTGRRFGV